MRTALWMYCLCCGKNRKGTLDAQQDKGIKKEDAIGNGILFLLYIMFAELFMRDSAEK